MADIRINSLNAVKIEQRDDIIDSSIDKNVPQENRNDIEKEIDALLSKDNMDKKIIDPSEFVMFLNKTFKLDSKMEEEGIKTSKINLTLGKVNSIDEDTSKNITDKSKSISLPLVKDMEISMDKPDKEKMDLTQLKEATSNLKDNNLLSLNVSLDKLGDVDKNQLLKDGFSLRNQVDSLLKSDLLPSSKVVVKDGIVIIHAGTNSLSIDSVNTIGAKGDLLFLDSSRQFANDSGYKEQGESSNQNSNQDRNQDDNQEGNQENENLDKIYFSGE